MRIQVSLTGLLACLALVPYIPRSAQGAESVQERLAAQRDHAYLTRLESISVAGFAEQDRLSHAVLARLLEQRIANHDFKEYEMPVNQMDGPQTHLADLPLAVPLDSVKHYEDYIARLHQIPRVLVQTKEVLRAGKSNGLMPGHQAKVAAR